jgi:integrase
MPKLKNRTPSIRKHASGQAIVTLGGRDHYLGIIGSPEVKRNFNTLMEEWYANGEHLPVHRIPESKREEFTVSDLAVRYHAYAKEHYFNAERNTMSGEFDNVRDAFAHVVALYAELPVKDFGPTHLRVIRAAMLKPKNEQGQSLRSRSYVNGAINRIRRVFKIGVSLELVPPSVLEALRAVDGIKRGKEGARETKKVQPVELTQVRAVLAVVPETLSTMIKLQLMHGMRPGEVCLMRRCDIDMTRSSWIYTPMFHKNQHHGLGRQVQLGQVAQTMLKPFLERCEPEEFLFSPKRAMQERYAACKTHRHQPPERPRTRRRVGSRYSTNTYAQAIFHACNTAGIPPWSPNQLRHRAATDVRAQFGIEAAMKVLGHTSLRMTENYAEAPNLDVSAIAETMASKISEEKKSEKA